MNFKQYFPLFLTVIFSIGSVMADPAPAVVKGLQMPAWVERGSERLPLRANQALQSGDKVITGSAARVLLALEEGSHIKLGENARLDLSDIKVPEKQSGIFTAAVDVLRGAFRFTTSLIGSNRQRNIDFRIGTITAGIRGTDIWGRSNNEKDLVCLIEGKINVASGSDSFEMSDPLSFYIKPKDAPAKPVSKVPPEKLTQWAKETELQNGHGVIQADGGYALNIMSLNSLASAKTNQQRFHQAGYASDIQQADVNGQTWYRLRINHIASPADARQLGKQLQQALGIDPPWVSAM